MQGRYMSETGADVHRAFISAWDAFEGRWKIWCGAGLRWAGKGNGVDVG